MNLQRFVDGTWAREFGIKADELTSGGVRVIADAPGFADYHGIYLLRIGDGCVVAAPANIADEVARITKGMSADDVFTRDVAMCLAGEEADIVLGPAWHGYVDESTFHQTQPCDAHRIDRDDGRIEDLRGAVDPAEWQEAGLMPMPAVVWGAFERHELVAIGKMSEFAGRAADVGVLTHPRVRGHGVGTRLVGAMVHETLLSSPVVRYRALEANLPSVGIAKHLGFVGRGRNIAVRLRA